MGDFLYFTLASHRKSYDTVSIQLDADHVLDALKPDR